MTPALETLAWAFAVAVEIGVPLLVLLIALRGGR